MVKRRYIAALAAGIASVGPVLWTDAPVAQTLTERLSQKSQKAGQSKDRLAVESRELVYDKDKNTVSAVGNAVLYYQGRVLEADRVTYDREHNRVYAEGNAKMTEANGQVVYGSRFELTDDFKDGFIDSLRIDTIDKTHFVAPRGERTGGETTVFERGTYTACDACKEDPTKPPLWQVRAKRIIHKNEERTVYYEDATLEFYGVPIAYIPYFSAPDSTVKRKSGFLAPRYIASSAIGYGVSVPYFWALAPNYDLTLTPTFLTRQGVLGDVEWRHRLINGSYTVRASGIFQADPGAFLEPPYGAGNRDFRGAVESRGRFLINDKWVWGWDVSGSTDKWYYSNYKFRGYQNDSALSAFGNTIGFRESTSTIYLTGQGERSWFDARAYYFRGLSYADWQKVQPVVHPVVDYDRRFTPAFIGGELSVNANLTSLTRSQTDYQSLVQENGVTPGRYLFPLAYDPLSRTNPRLYDTCAPGFYTPDKCYVRGPAGTYTRMTADVSWRRTFIDPLGQTWTPFLSARGDVLFKSPDLSPPFNQYLPNFFDTNDDVVFRGMPAVGVTYRYPFVADTSWGTHVIEPIGQIIARPNETNIGKIVNEDAQSLVFDDTNLFSTTKFSGYDRMEGGTRANIGAQYTFTMLNGGYISSLFGQSYQIAGLNSYANPDLTRTGLNSGLDTARSDYVSRIQIAPTSNIVLTARSRFNEEDFALKRVEMQAQSTFGDLTTSIIYARYAPQPELGIYTKREGVSTSVRYNITPNWYVTGSVLLDLSRHAAERFYQIQGYQASNPVGVGAISLGAGYHDECTTFSVVYQNSAKGSLAEGTKERVQTVLLRLELRTLGGASYSYNQSTIQTSDGITHY
ncbi:LPS-assembly protein LptD [Alsobacter soli]|uniref:LPS-assembly protein LptD n=2 Tax=Alsobacter soli TaxID=2109933 RepID=A0A2T1HVZ7_9HYPH|nr:LPS-assembly protein LptD [Alsobacter soli]